jgi:hypothetical protein
VDRRGFFAAAAPLVALGATQVRPSLRVHDHDRFDAANGWVVQWGGWKGRDNQAVEIGAWWALKPSVTHAYYSTTGGEAGKIDHFTSLVSMVQRPDWPWITVITDEQTRRESKLRALDALLKLL